MVLKNLLALFGVVLAYFSLFILVPFWLRGFRLTGEKVLDKMVSTFLLSHIIIILAVYALTLIGIYNRLTVLLLLFFIAVGYRLLFRRKQTLLSLDRLGSFFLHVTDGSYPVRVLVKQRFQSLKYFFLSIGEKTKQPLGLLFTLAIFGFGAYLRCYHAVTNLFFPTSDMYLHTEWTKFFMHNEPFFAGVYPFGFHGVVASLSSVFGLNVVTVMQMLSPICGLLTVFSLYYLLRRVMRSTFAVNFALALYVVTNIFPFYASERQIYALPQEYGTMFLYLAAYFLYEYMKEKKTRSLICFSAAVSLTLLIHFFITIYAILICVCIFIACLTYLNRKVFVRLVAGVLCALLIAIAPLATGLLKGIEFNGSMDWALSFILGSDEEPAAGGEAETGLPAPGESGESDSGALTLGTVIRNPALLYHMLLRDEMFSASYDLSLLNATWFVPYLIIAGLALLLPIFKFKSAGRLWMFPALAVYSLLLGLLFVLSFYEIFTLMEYSRLYQFFIYSIPLVVGAPFELLCLLCDSPKKEVRAVYLTLIAAVGAAGMLYTVTYQRFMPFARVWQSQYNGAVLAYYDIARQFSDEPWMIVSSMSEYALCLFDGYHYEMSDFILNMSDYDKSTELFLDADSNVFIYVVKRPNLYLDTHLQQLGAFTPLPPFDEDDVYVDLAAEFGAEKGTTLTRLYQNYEANRVLQAKAYAWAQEYKKYFPNEMSVFYEDDEIIVYRVRQNPYSSNNFAIPYAGNTAREEGDPD